MSKQHSFRTTIGALGVVLMCLGSFASTASASRDEPARDEKSRARQAETPPRDEAPPLLDLQFLEVSKSVPQFAGLYGEPDSDRLHVNLTDISPGVVRAAEHAVAEVFDELPGLKKGLVPHKVEHSFGELWRWYTPASPSALSAEGTVFTDIDEKANQLVVGVADPSVAKDVSAIFAGSGTPAGVVQVEVIATVDDENLTQAHIPHVGGLRIRNDNGGGCTLGFNAKRQGVNGFVTNSHCTNAKGGIENSFFYQPAQIVCSTYWCNFPTGIEVADPAYQPTVWDPLGCPSGRVCRLSDSAFVNNFYVTNAPSPLNKIARPASSFTTAWNGSDTYDIAFAMNPLSGQAVTKVGATTGRTNGYVLSTCVSVNSSNPSGGQPVTNLCQYHGGYASGPGDSGSPVFMRFGSTAILVGLHWGSGGWFSPWSSVAYELALSEV